VLLEASEVSVVFGAGGKEEHTAVRDVSLSIGAGESVGLVGESGSGKTTLAMVLAGLTPLTAGRITFDGIERTGRTGRLRGEDRASVQMIFQDPKGALDPRQRLTSGFSELRATHMTRTNWITDKALMGIVGLAEDLLDRYPHEISGGEAQRVCIARALLLRPRLLIGDEPTSALDVSIQAEIIRLVQQLQRSEGFSLLLVSHDFGVVAALCDRIYVLLKGEVVEHGSTVAILSAPSAPYTQALLAAVPGRDAFEASEPSMIPAETGT